MRIAIAAIAFVVVLLTGTLALLWFGGADDDRFAACRQTRVAGGTGSLGGELSLIDETGQQVGNAEIFDKPTLLYFGYAYCPDVCPLDSARNSEAIGLLADKGIEINHALISIDPQRDTPEVLAEFTSYFDDTMLGLTGSPEQIAAAAKAFRVFYGKNGEGEDYLMDHSTFTYLVAQDGSVVEVFRRSLRADELAQSLECFVNQMG